MLFLVEPILLIDNIAVGFLRATFVFTIVSAVHYAFLVQHRLHGPGSPPAIQS